MAALTIAQLQTKAQEVDDLVYEAQIVEMNKATALIMSMIPRSFVIDAAESAGYVSVHDMVTGVAKVDASNYGDAASFIARATRPSSGSALSELDSEISNVKDVVRPEMWDGEAARAYRSDHLNVYPDVASLQVSALDELHGAMTSFEDLLEEAYSSLDEVLENSKEALQSIIDGGDGGSSRAVTFAAISAAVSIAGAVATGGTSVAIGFAVAGGGIGVLSASLPSGGGATTTITDNIHESIGKLQERIDEFDEALAEGLRTDIDLVEDRLNVPVGGSSTPIEVPRPAFADDPSRL